MPGRRQRRRSLSELRFLLFLFISSIPFSFYALYLLFDCPRRENKKMNLERLLHMKRVGKVFFFFFFDQEDLIFGVFSLSLSLPVLSLSLEALYEKQDIMPNRMMNEKKKHTRGKGGGCEQKMSMSRFFSLSFLSLDDEQPRTLSPFLSPYLPLSLSVSLV